MGKIKIFKSGWFCLVAPQTYYFSTILHFMGPKVTILTLIVAAGDFAPGAVLCSSARCAFIKEL